MPVNDAGQLSSLTLRNQAGARTALAERNVYETKRTDIVGGLQFLL